LQDLLSSPALKASGRFSAERGVTPLRLLILDSRSGPFSDDNAPPTAFIH
jgi:hypothetical protein